MDAVAVEQDRRIARRLRRDKRVLRLAQRNLARWLADEKRPRRVLMEWRNVLNRLTASEIADFLESGTPMARRLAQSSPFAGVLSDRERAAILRKHEKART
jgi:hypothetical protein